MQTRLALSDFITNAFAASERFMFVFPVPVVRSCCIDIYADLTQSVHVNMPDKHLAIIFLLSPLRVTKKGCEKEVRDGTV